MSTREYKLNKIKELGFKIRTLGKSLTESKCICATKDGEEHRGSVCKVFKKLFGYCQLKFSHKIGQMNICPPCRAKWLKSQEKGYFALSI